MFGMFNVGEDSLRDERISRIDEIYDSYGVTYEKVDQENKCLIYYYIKNAESFDDFHSTQEAILIDLMKDSLTIVTLIEFYGYLEKYYYQMMVKKASCNEIPFDYYTCCYMVEGKHNGIFSGEGMDVLQFLLNKGLISCNVLEKKFGPKDHIQKIAKKDFYIKDNSGCFKRYVSEEHMVTVTTTRLSAMYIIDTLLHGYRIISYSRGRDFVVEYKCNKDLFNYISNHKQEFDEIVRGYRFNFEEAENMLGIG